MFKHITQWDSERVITWRSNDGVLFGAAMLSLLAALETGAAGGLLVLVISQKLRFRVLPAGGRADV